MKKIDFGNGWSCRQYGAEQGQMVTLPHDAMLSEPRTAQCAGGTNTGWFEGHNYIYKKVFVAPNSWNGQVPILEFEGVYHNTEVYLNGTQVGFHAYGYSGFYVNLSGYLHFDAENTIEVIAHNDDQPNSRWYSGAGIYRPVWLYVLPIAHIELNGLKIRTLDYKQPTIRVSLMATAPGEAHIEILTENTVLATSELHLGNSGEADIPLPDAKLWSPESPNLYTCRVVFGTDTYEERFGIRMVTCDSRNGFCINGERVVLRGACIHHDNGLLGAVAHPFAEWRKIRLLKEAGYNAIRSAHNPCSKALLDACDVLGMLVLDEYADMWYIHKTQYDYAKYVLDCWKQDLSDLVDKDYNHPSVIMYSIGNEVSETAQPRGIALCNEMVQFLHSKDDRPVTCGINIFFNFLSSMGFGVYSDKKAEQEAKRAEQRNSTSKRKRAVGSEFFNNLAGLLGSDFMKFGATLHGSDVKTRDSFSVLDVAGYNYGVNRYKKDFRKYPDRVILGSETFVADAVQFWEQAKCHPALIGDFVWAGIDYLGEVGLGAKEYKDYAPDFGHGPGWIAAGVGVLDLTGRSTGQTAYTQVAFERTPIRIAVVPVNHTLDAHSPSAWRMSNAMESWSWNGCEGKKATVEVYARAEKVTLFLNEKQIAFGKPDKNCRVAFRVTWAPGELTAVAYDSNGQVLGRDVLQSAGEQTRLTLFPEQEWIEEQDLSYIRLCYTDEQGVLKPLVRGDIHVQVDGGTLLALGSANPYNERGFLSDTTDTYYGEALAIVRPDGPGILTIKANSPFGISSATVICGRAANKTCKEGQEGTE